MIGLPAVVGHDRYRCTLLYLIFQLVDRGRTRGGCVGRERPKLFAVERSARLRAVVCQQLREGPASIAGRLPTEYAADESPRVSHEAICQ